jgi:flagellar hook-associated protein 3 FlgL
MSASITMTGVTGNATLTQLIQNTQATKTRLDQITNQVSTGLIADNYAGLGSGASVSLNLSPQVANLQTWQNNVDAATGQMSVAQTALTGIQSIAASFYAQLNNVQGVNASAVDTIAASARDALSQVASALDTQDGGVYVFAGQDTGNPPVPDPDNIANPTVNPTGFFGSINSEVGKLGQPGYDAATVANYTLTVAKSDSTGPSPFSQYLSDYGTIVNPSPPPLPTIQVGNNHSEPIGLAASANSLIPASVSGTPAIPGVPTTTGSYMRDILRALATIGSLTSAQAANPALQTDFQNLVQDTRISLSGAADALAQDQGVLGNVQSSLTATQSNLADTQTTLTSQVSSAQDVDMAATLSQLSSVQTQMQASYQLIATLNGMSLAKFLPAS